MENLLVFIDSQYHNKEVSPLAIYRWSWVYAHGKFEEDYGFDVVMFNKEEPGAEGYYLAIAENSKTVVVNMVADKYGKLKGRCSYIDDLEALDYINSPKDWM